MSTTFRSLVCALGGMSVLSSGCAEYFEIDAACVEGGSIKGGDELDAIESTAGARIDCYRRLAGLGRASFNDEIQAAIDGHLNYLLQNPESAGLTSGGILTSLSQSMSDDAFTGVNLAERLSLAEYTQSPFPTGTWEYIAFSADYDANDVEPIHGSNAVDELARIADFRQVVLQPSWIDGGWGEIELPPEWWAEAGWSVLSPNVPPPNGRAFYVVVVYESPPLEGAGDVITMPKVDQLDVPLYSNAIDANTGAPTQLSWPITMSRLPINPAFYGAGSASPTDIRVVASIRGPDGVPLDVRVVHPDDGADGPWPDGLFLQDTVAIYARDPFEPRTVYTVFANVTTSEDREDVEFTFTTAAEDEGVAVGQNASTSPSTSMTPSTTMRTLRQTGTLAPNTP